MKRATAGRPLWLLACAALGGTLLLIVAANRWGQPSDEHAYWLAARRLIEGQPLYDPLSTITTPFAYLYPPPLAQMLVPVAAVLPSAVFSLAWTFLMAMALWWLAGRDLIRALALLAFPPIAVEFWFRNVHLFLAVLVVLGLYRAPGWFVIGAAIKVSPGLGIVYDWLRGQWRSAGIATMIGLGVLALSVALGVEQWRQYLSFIGTIDPMSQSAFVAIPFPVRAAAALVMVVVAARSPQPTGALLLVVAVTLALPSLWFTGLSLLAALVPIWRNREERAGRGPT